MLAYTMEALIYNAEEIKIKDQLRSEKLRLTSLMATEIISDRCQTCQEDETNHHLLGF